MIILMFVTALLLSTIAAWYAIVGLMAIFAAAALPIAIMGGTLEVAKLVVASWMYHNWKEIPKLLKTYFCIALVVLMTLTSMGIFGFLSKAHLDQAVPTGDVQAKVSLLEEKINQEKEIINESRKTLNQLDQQVNEIINRTASATDTKAIERSISTRKRQATERKQIFNTISAAQANIAKYNEEKAPLSSEIRKIEAEVGPIKYIAALIYGDQIDQSLLEKAVRIVILMIVSVFDPLAVLMLVAANWTLKHRKEEEPEGWKKVWQPTSEEWPPYEPDFPDIEEIRKQCDVDQNMKMTESLFDTEEEFFAHGKEVARELDAAEGRLPDDYASTQAYLKGPVSWIKSTGTEGLVPKDTDDWDPTFMKIFDGADVIPSPKPPHQELTIEKEVEKLQKSIEYDSAGRRITP